jgi:hypothetical protein
MFFYDVPNLLGVLILVTISFRMGLIPLWMLFFLSLFSFIPFILNDVIFPTKYMPDQIRYFWYVQQLRDLDFELLINTKLVVSSWMLALIPLPYVETVNSLGFFSRLMATALIIWLYSSKNIRGWPLLFMMFYPSFLLYSSLGLRDTLVLMFMMTSVIFFIENKRILALIVASPLLYIKFQNFFLLILFFIVHLYFAKGSLFYRYRFIFFGLVLAILIPYLTLIIELLNFYRAALFAEDGGDMNKYIPVDSFSEFLLLGLQAAPYFLMKPWPWESSNLMQLIQSVENIFLLLFLVFIFSKAYKLDKNISIKWIVYLIFAMGVYGMVVYNFGTAVRYKFPFILIVIIGLSYELYFKHGKFISNK